MRKYFYTYSPMDGLITHEDQEEAGLSFLIPLLGGNVIYLIVDGEPDRIALWADRVKAIEACEDDKMRMHYMNLPKQGELDEYRVRDAVADLAQLVLQMYPDHLADSGEIGRLYRFLEKFRNLTIPDEYKE